MALDPVSRQVVLFGHRVRFLSQPYFEYWEPQTWTWDGETWTRQPHRGDRGNRTEGGRADNHTDILTGIDNRTVAIANPLDNPDQYGQHVTDSSGAVVGDLTFAPVNVTDGNIYVGQ